MYSIVCEKSTSNIPTDRLYRYGRGSRVGFTVDRTKLETAHSSPSVRPVGVLCEAFSVLLVDHLVII